MLYAWIAILIISIGLVVVVTIAFGHSHRDFLKRKEKYDELASRITRGEGVELAAMAFLIPQDRLALQLLQSEVKRGRAEAELGRERQGVAEQEVNSKTEPPVDVLSKTATDAAEEFYRRQSGI